MPLIQRDSPLRTAKQPILAALGLALLVSCGTGAGRRGADHYDRTRLEKTLAEETSAGLLIGEFALAPGAVVDGDTVKVEGLDSSLRLLAIDTEETFKSEKDLRLYESLGFEGYLEKKGQGSERPAKCATPVGMDAKHFAEDFFRGATTIRLERDHPKELRGHYGRVLAYVFVNRAGEWVNYNIESVRAGMSPYFSKYGYSRRFHDEFVEAQNEARAAGRGIWDPSLEHYRDYDVRLEWWNGRGDFLRRFEEDSNGRTDLIALTHWDALDRLSDAEGREVELLAGVGDIKLGDGRIPTRVQLSRRMFSSFPLIFFDDEVVDRSRIASAQGEFVRVRGTVTSYTYKSKRLRKQKNPDVQLQIVVRAPEQIVISDTAPAPKTLEGRLGDGVLGGVKGGVLGGTPPPTPPAEPVPPSAEPVGPPSDVPPPPPEPPSAEPPPANDEPGSVPPPPPPAG